METNLPESIQSIKEYLSYYAHLNVYIFVTLIVVIICSCSSEESKERKVNFKVVKRTLKCREMDDSCRKRWKCARQLNGVLIILNRDSIKKGYVGKYISCSWQHFLNEYHDSIWVDGCFLAPPPNYRVRGEYVRIYRYYYR